MPIIALEARVGYNFISFWFLKFSFGATRRNVESKNPKGDIGTIKPTQWNIL